MARPLSEEARQKALDAALEIIGELGIDGFTVDAVAKRSGVAKTTIYRHFASGNELMIAAVDCMVQPFATPNTGSLASDLEAFMEIVIPIMDDHSMQRTMMSVLSAAASDPELARVHHELMQERMLPIRTMVELAQGRGEVLPELDLDLVMDFIEGPFFFRKMIRQQALTGDDIRSMVDLIVKALTLP